MYRCEKGVLEKSEIYFYTPGIISKNTFFYLICLGHFWCNNEYYVKRQKFNSYLVLYIVGGTVVI